MKKKIVITISALVIMCILFVVGLSLVFSASSIGENAGNSFVRSQGGSYLTDQVNRIVNSTTLSYQLGGLAISLTGGSGILISGYALYKET